MPRPRAVDLWEEPKYYTGPADPLEHSANSGAGSSAATAIGTRPTGKAQRNGDSHGSGVPPPVSLRLNRRPRGYASRPSSNRERDDEGHGQRWEVTGDLPRFTIPEDAIPETRDMVVAGEDPNCSAWDEELDIPIRVLNNFTI